MSDIASSHAGGHFVTTYFVLRLSCYYDCLVTTIVVPIGLAHGTTEFGARRSRVAFHVVRRSAVSEARLVLPNFYNVTIRIANVAACLAIPVLWLCDKLGSPTSP